MCKTCLSGDKEHLHMWQKRLSGGHTSFTHEKGMFVGWQRVFTHVTKVFVRWAYVIYTCDKSVCQLCIHHLHTRKECLSGDKECLHMWQECLSVGRTSFTHEKGMFVRWQRVFTRVTRVFVSLSNVSDDKIGFISAKTYKQVCCFCTQFALLSIR